MKHFHKLVLIGFILCANDVLCQNKTENIMLIMTDGLRWQDVFEGADSTLLFDKKYTTDSSRTAGKFWAKNSIERREKLMPFFWKTIGEKGQIYGNRKLGSKVNVTNPYFFSYPGYNEVLTGYADIKVNSNDKNLNENVTVLEYLNNQPKLKGKVAAFTTWDVFPFIINSKRSGILVNSGLEKVKGSLTPKEELLNQIIANVPSMASDRFDFVTYYLAKEYLIKAAPKVMFISFDETDEFAHEAKYKEYLFAANTFDTYLADLWNYCQNNPKYKDKTTFIVTTDHGRGDKTKSQWTSHGQKVPDSNEIWMAVIGPDTKAIGEVKKNSQLYQNQIASTLANLLGYDFKGATIPEKKPIGEVVLEIIK